MDEKGAERLLEKLERLSKLGDTDTAAFIAEELEGFYNHKLKDFDPKHQDQADTSKRLEVIKKIGDVNMMVGRIDKGKDFYDKVLALAPSSAVAASVHRRLAWLSIRDSDWKAATEGYHRALNISQKCNDDLGIGKATRGLGYIAWRKGDFDEAFERFTKATRIFETKKAQIELGMSLTDIGNIHSEKGDIDTAIGYYKKALAALINTQNAQELGRVNNNIGNNLMIKGEYQKAIPYLTEEIKIGKKYNDKILVAMGQMHLAECLARLGRLDEAKDLCQQSLKAFKETGYKLGVTMITFPIGLTHWFSGDREKASKMMEDGIAETERLGLLPLVAEYCFDYGHILKDAGEVVRAKKQLRKALTMFAKMKADGYVKMVEAALKDMS